MIDGRFRVGCFFACMLHITRPTKVLFDDYSEREWYWQVEKFYKPVELKGRMAVFDMVPMKISNKDWTQIIGSFAVPK